MYTFFLHFEARVAEPATSTICRAIWFIKFKIMAKSYKDVNEHEEWNFDFTELVEFEVSKHF